MDSPICVFDAQTFVDHIHEIKAWLYGRHLRIVVPVSTADVVEQLYKKSLEPKLTTHETSKHKPLGKPARKAYPTFDINPIIAREYLARIKKGQEGEVYVKERPDFEKEEDWEAVQFQTLQEEYTPWKKIPVEVEREEAVDDRPLSWAELAKKKLSQANGSGDNAQATKGPAKPKLVSKASGNDASPWKLQKNAPTISAKYVPGPLRSLMSCALWRLHESIDRNDSNQLFLLSDQEQLHKVAKKLNILVRSTWELSDEIAKSVPNVDLNSWGLLEEEGLAKSKDGLKTDVPGEESVSQVNSQGKIADLAASENEYKEAHAEHDVNPQIPGEGMQAHPPEIYVATDASADILGKSETPSAPSDTQTAEVEVNPKDLVQSILDASAIQARHAVEAQQAVEGANAASLQPAAEIVEFPRGQVNTNAPTQASIPTEVPGNAQKLGSSDIQESQEDSDEEVVVFVPNPKRASVQKKAIAACSRPSTAQGQSPTKSTQEPTTPTRSNVQIVPKAHAQGSRNAKAVGQGNPRPLSSGPTIIDPNAFGRGFAVNPDSSPQTSTRNSRSRHSPRGSMQYSNPSLSTNTGSPQNSPRTSPPRHKAARSPRPNARTSPQKHEEAQTMEIPVISHQAFTRAPLVAPVAQNTHQSRFGPIGPPKPGHIISPLGPVRDPDFVRDVSGQRPKSANGPASDHASQMPQRYSPRPRPNPPNENGGSIRGGHHGRRTARPSLFEPELDNTAAQPSTDVEPRKSNMPDVQYTLKSGRPRESTRGKGKLWVG